MRKLTNDETIQLVESFIMFTPSEVLGKGGYINADKITPHVLYHLRNDTVKRFKKKFNKDLVLEFKLEDDELLVKVFMDE